MLENKLQTWVKCDILNEPLVLKFQFSWAGAEPASPLFFLPSYQAVETRPASPTLKHTPFLEIEVPGLHDTWLSHPVDIKEL